MTEPDAPWLPPADVPIDEQLVRGLLRAQQPDLADLPLRHVATGWDNVTYRLGEALAVRLPRITAAADLVVKEQQWLPRLAATVPVATPVPVRTGVPGQGYPWRWSIVPWTPGRTAAVDPLHPEQAALFGRVLAGIRAAAEGCEPGELPRNDYRGIPLRDVDDVDARMQRLLASSTAEDGAALGELWRQARSAPIDADDVLLHGDLHAKNLVSDRGRLVAVLDWGDMTLGDPATDLGAMWMHFPVEAHDDVLAAYGPPAPTPETLVRARGWALVFALNLWEAGAAGDTAFAAVAATTFQRLVRGQTRSVSRSNLPNH